MKYILSIFLAVTFLLKGNAQNEPTGFTVKGTFDSSVKADSVLLFSEISDKIIARAPIVDGKFEFKGSISEPQEAVLCYKTKESGKDGEKTSGKMILENADYTFDRKGYNIKIKGGKLHDMVLGFESSDAYHAALNDLRATNYAVFNNKEESYEPTPEESKLIGEKTKAALDIEDRALNKVIKDPKAPVLAKVFALARTQDWDNYPLEKRVELLNAYEKEQGSSSLTLTNYLDGYQELIEQEKLAQAVAPGMMYKEVVAKKADGKEIKLSEVVAKNKFTILEFWASWCAPCRSEIPNLKKAYEKYKSKGLEIYSVSIDEKSTDWLKALEDENTKWIQVIDGDKTADKYGVQAVPASFLIGQDGKIIAVDNALIGSELDKTLSKIMP